MKKLLLVLFISILGLIGFGYCDTVSSLIQNIDNGSLSLEYNVVYNLYDLGNGSDNYGTYCLKVNSISQGNGLMFGYNSSSSSMGGAGSYLYFWNDNVPAIGCVKSNLRYINLKNSYYGSNLLDFDYSFFKLDDLLAENLPVMTSNECQSTYNLIPIENVDTQYCMLNNLCPSSGECDIEGSGFSNVFVYRNNNYFPITGTKNIYVNLPSYIGYNYGYSNGGDDLDINVSVSQDTGYIEGVLNVQNYKPSSEDFTKLVGMLAPYSKYLVFLVFIFIIWAWIKKSFKSKKL